MDSTRAVHQCLRYKSPRNIKAAKSFRSPVPAGRSRSSTVLLKPAKVRGDGKRRYGLVPRRLTQATSQTCLSQKLFLWTPLTGFSTGCVEADKRRERVKGIEPSSTAWKAVVLAVVLHPQILIQEIFWPIISRVFSTGKYVFPGMNTGLRQSRNGTNQVLVSARSLVGFSRRFLVVLN